MVSSVTGPLRFFSLLGFCGGPPYFESLGDGEVTETIEESYRPSPGCVFLCMRLCLDFLPYFRADGRGGWPARDCSAPAVCIVPFEALDALDAPAGVVTMGGFCIELLALGFASTKDFICLFDVDCEPTCCFLDRDGSPRWRGLGATVIGDGLASIDAVSSICCLLLPASCVWWSVYLAEELSMFVLLGL